MPSVCFYFQVHQPFRLKPFNCFQIGKDHSYFDDSLNRKLMQRVALKCYLPANRLLLDLIHKHKGRFRVAFSITGTALEQFEMYAPEVLASYKELAQTGCVELLGETYHHSLSFLYSADEFIREVKLHSAAMENITGQRPEIFRNTELVYNNELAITVHALGFRGIICEGVDHLLGLKSPNFVYHVPGLRSMKCLLKNYQLSDDIAFRFSDKGWAHHPLKAETYARWIRNLSDCSDTVNLFMDYETFGEHQWGDSGIFHFLRQLPDEILNNGDFEFRTPSEVIASYPASQPYDVPDYTSWADHERDLSAWLGNDLQRDAMERVFAMEQSVKNTDNAEILDTWAKLLTSDHFYYMSTKHWSDGEVHKYFSPYKTPYDAYINYMNVLHDFEGMVRKVVQPTMPIELSLN